MSQSINSLPVGALVKDTGTTAKYSISAGYQMIWRIIGKNHDATNSITLESAYAIVDSNWEGHTGNQTIHLAEQQDPAFIADLVNFSSDINAKMKTITKNCITHIPYYVSGVPSATSPFSKQIVNKSGKVHIIGQSEISGENVYWSAYKAGAYAYDDNPAKDGNQYSYYSNYASNREIVRKPYLNSKSSYPYGMFIRTHSDYIRSSGAGAGTTTTQSYIRNGTGSSDGIITRGGSTDYDGGSTWYPNAYAPLICVDNNIFVSDTTDSDGAYTIVWNTPPRISTPSTDLGDRTKAFSTTFQVADDEGDTVSATINLDSTTIQTIASVTLGADNTIAIDATTFRNLALGSHTISIIANDGTESVTTTISFQKVSGMGISGSDGDLGNIWIQPTITYQVYDDNDLQVDITEKVDGVVTNEIEDAPLNTDITFDMSVFGGLTPEEQHTLKIEAVNADESTAERTWTFTKLYQYLQFYTDTVETDILAERIYVVLDYDKTNDPEIQVWVCNDAGGMEWHYEDATEDVLNGEPHTFHYTPAEGTEGVSVMVRLIKNENTERVYFNNIGFTFS